MIILPQELANYKDGDSTFYVELYVFHLVFGDMYIAALDADVDFYIPGTTTPVKYLSCPIKREEIKSTVDCKTDGTTISVENIDDRFTAALFSGYEFTHKVVEIIQIKYPESLNDPSAFMTVFKGYLDAPKLDRGKATFEAQVKSFAPDCQPGRTMMLSCNAEFGDPEDCGASKDTQTGTIQSGSNVHAIYIQQTKPDGYWRNGIITIGYESKMIEDSVGNKIVLRYPFYFVPQGIYTVERGCDKTNSTCKAYVNNSNYSGFPSIPFELQIKS